MPTAAQANLAYQVGHRSLADDPDKLRHCGVEIFDIDGQDLPFVSGCSAWLACRLVPEPRNQQVYDLFIGEIEGAWADTRAFAEGHWHFERADPAWRSLHYVAGGHFYATGEAVDVGPGRVD